LIGGPQRSEMPVNLKRASLTATCILVAAVLGLLARRSLFAARPAPLALQGLAALLMLWARLTFGKRSFHATANPTGGGLITRGPYKFLRHPIYAAILLFVWAGVASHASRVNVLLAGLASAAIAVRIGAEERLLIESYPEYVAYASHTKRVIPFVI
jgi:protein-S-isoprenylcysteine O-methyltransferase Ste14